MSEPCQRCNKVGEDRRTLSMSCFYKMSELGIPLEEELLMTVRPDAVEHVVTARKYSSTRYHSDGTMETVEGTYQHTERSVEAKAEVTPQSFYTMRVCKSCRADWMEAIREWFVEAPANIESCGSGIFVRKNGSTVEVTAEEFEAMRVTHQ